jgi:hypothetical protein
LWTAAGVVHLPLPGEPLGGDCLDAGLEAISRGLKFAVLALQPVPATDTPGERSLAGGFVQLDGVAVGRGLGGLPQPVAGAL